MLIFVSGNVRSGKSSFAEQLAKERAGNGHLHYIATSRITDNEMKIRIMRHQDERKRDDVYWNTWELPLNIHEISDQISTDDTVLLDCLTVLTANELFKNDSNEDWKQVYEHIFESIRNLASCCKTFIVVSNEVFREGIPQEEGTFEYMRLLGRLHQQLVYAADEAYLIKHGIAVQKK
jgi:adenosylcobinamide kinase/adenosylcobinamide-phosphate guanylyltransferase